VEGGVPPLGVPPGADGKPALDRLLSRAPSAILHVRAPVFGCNNRFAGSADLLSIWLIIADKTVYLSSSFYLLYFLPQNSVIRIFITIPEV
jgi:hypothetical protein